MNKNNEDLEAIAAHDASRNYHSQWLKTGNGDQIEQMRVALNAAAAWRRAQSPKPASARMRRAKEVALRLELAAMTQDRDDARRELADAPDPADARLAALEIGSLKEALAEAEVEKERLREALAPFASLRVARLMTSGLKYDFRIDAGDIRKAIAALTGAPHTSEDSPKRL